MGKQYQLSIASQKAGREFRYAGKVTSSLFKPLKILIRKKSSRSLYNNLCSLVIKIIHTGPVELKGNRKLSDGDLSLFRGFRLNHYQYLSNLTEFRPEIRFSMEEKYIEMTTSPLNWSAFMLPFRARMVGIAFQCILLDPDSFEIEIITCDDLEVPLDEKGIGAKRIKIPIKNVENKVVILSMSVYIHLIHTHNRDTFISGNRKHFAGEILNAVYIKDGKIMPFTAGENPVESKVISEEHIQTIPWTDA